MQWEKNKGVIWTINYDENSSFLKAPCFFHSSQANCFSWKLNSTREKRVISLNKWRCLTVRMKKRAEYKPLWTWCFPLSLQAGVLKCRGKPTIILREHVLKGTSSSKIRNRPTELEIQLLISAFTNFNWLYFLTCLPFCDITSALLLLFGFFFFFFLLCFQVYWSCGSNSWKVMGDNQFSIVMVLVQHYWFKGYKS